MEEKINEAEVSPVAETALPRKRKRKTDFYIELSLFLVLGILMGIAIKTEASKRITIGFDDYKMNILPKGYDINELQKEEIRKQAEENLKQSENASGEAGQTFENDAESVSGGSCQ